jgi:hypothetical protein
MARCHAAAQGGPEARLRALAARAREDLRRRAAAGDRRARRDLVEIGEPLPAVRHWADRDDDTNAGT